MVQNMGGGKGQRSILSDQPDIPSETVKSATNTAGLTLTLIMSVGQQAKVQPKAPRCPETISLSGLKKEITEVSAKSRIADDLGTYS